MLLVDAGVTLYASRNPADYQVASQPACRHPGCLGRPHHRHRQWLRPFIAIPRSAANAGIMGSQVNGHQGVIDGRGDQQVLGASQTWWQLAESAHDLTTEQQENPKLIAVFGASKATLYHISLTNSPMYNVVLDSGNGFVAGESHRQPRQRAQHRRFDPDSATNVLITDTSSTPATTGSPVKSDAGGRPTA